MATVVELTSYPIKGCAGMPAGETMLTPAGLAHDRSFMVVGEQGVFRTQRRDPKPATIRPAVSAEGQRLTLRTPGIEDLDLRGRAAQGGVVRTAVPGHRPR